MKTKTQVNIEYELANARAKHPLFASNAPEGISIIGEEFGELCKAVNEDNRSQAEEEALDTIAVLVRFLEGDDETLDGI